MNGQEFSIDKPEELYLGLKKMSKLKGETSLAVYERVGVSMTNGMSWVGRHWFISFLVFSVVGGFVYRYLTFHGPKRLPMLPTYRTAVNNNSHKD